MNCSIPHRSVFDALFTELQQYLVDTDADGTVHGLLALDILRTTLEPELYGAALIERLMPRIAALWCHLQYREDLSSEDLEQILERVGRILGQLIFKRPQSPPEAVAAD